MVRNVLGGSFALLAAPIIALAGFVAMATAAGDELSQDYSIVLSNIRLQQDLKDPNKRVNESFVSKS